jgi:hypothetical protein
MATTVNDARRPDAAAGTDAIYRSLFDSFNPDKDGRISPLEVLSRLERSGQQPDDPRIAEALTGPAGADGGSREGELSRLLGALAGDARLVLVVGEGLSSCIYSPSRLREVSWKSPIRSLTWLATGAW